MNKIVGNDDYDIPEKPITTEEFFFAGILGEAVQAPEPSTRYQIYLAKIAGKNVEIPYPKTRLEYFLARAAGMNVETPTPITREEILWSNYTAIVEFELEGVPPLTYKAIEGTLKNYRIYGNTVDGESVGDRTANLFVNLWKKGYIRADNGREEQIDGFICSGFFPVEYGQTYSISRNINVGYDNVRGYRDDGSFIGAGTDICDVSNPFPSAATNIGAFTVTNENVAFIRFNDSANDLGMKYMIVKGTYTKQTMPDYEPYGYEVPVTVEGKNLFSSRIEQGSFDGITGVPNNSSTRVRSHEDDYIFLTPGVYKISAMGVEHLVVYAYDLPDVNAFNYNLSRTNWAPLPSTITINTSAYYKFGFCKTNNPIITPSDISNIMLNAGSDALPYEPYHAPVTTPIYLPEPIKMVGDEAEYIDYAEQKQHFSDGTSGDVELPALPTIAGTNVLTVGTEVQPSKVYIKGEKGRD